MKTKIKYAAALLLFSLTVALSAGPALAQAGVKNKPKIGPVNTWFQPYKGANWTKTGWK